jgi:hypothetical protein
MSFIVVAKLAAVESPPAIRGRILQTGGCESLGFGPAERRACFFTRAESCSATGFAVRLLQSFAENGVLLVKILSSMVPPEIK